MSLIMGKEKKMSRAKSGLTKVVKLTDNCTKPRNAKISRITPHCIAGKMTAEAALTFFKNSTNSSANYVIGHGGKIGLSVRETDRAWTTSSGKNDNKAITVEISNSAGAPNWPMSEEAVDAFVALTVDICEYYGFKKVVYYEKPMTIAIGEEATEKWITSLDVPKDALLVTLHRWYKNKACPGKWFVKRLPEVVSRINKEIKSTKKEEKPATEKAQSSETKVIVTVSALNVRKGPGVDYPITKVLKNDKEVRTIVDKKKGLASRSSKNMIEWGELKSGAGWIAMKHTKKV